MGLNLGIYFAVFESVIFEKGVVLFLVAFGDQSEFAVEKVSGGIVLGIQYIILADDFFGHGIDLSD